MFIGTSTFTKVVCNHALQQVRRHGNTIALTIETTFAVKMKALFFTYLFHSCSSSGGIYIEFHTKVHKQTHLIFSYKNETLYSFLLLLFFKLNLSPSPFSALVTPA